MNRVVAIISRRNSKGFNEYLLVKTTETYGEFKDLYGPPGGHVEEAEPEDKAVVREVKEELNLDVKALYRIAESDADFGEGKINWWKCEMTSADFEKNDEEIADAGFFSIDAMKKLNLWPATRKFFERYIVED